jgi:hypothetical protein
MIGQILVDVHRAVINILEDFASPELQDISEVTTRERHRALRTVQGAFPTGKTLLLCGLVP